MKPENPTVDINEFKAEDYVIYGDLGPGTFYGLIYGVDNENEGDNDDCIHFVHFEHGYPGQEHIIPKYGCVRKIAKQEFDQHLTGLVARYQNYIHGGLEGAIEARRQHYIEEVQKFLKEVGPQAITFFESEGPKTGIYVLEGTYVGGEPVTRLQGLKVNPRLPEKLVGPIMMNLFPEGIQPPPPYIYDTPGVSPGRLTWYQAYEVPEKALFLVRNPKELELICKF